MLLTKQSSRSLPVLFFWWLAEYTVSVFKFLETDTETLNHNKMIILIPFALLKMRKAMKNARTPENIEALRNIIQNDIIGGVEKNLEAGNITVADAQRLKRLTHKLYEHIYADYDELEVLNEMTDESLMLDIDILEKKHEEEMALVIADKDKVLQEMDKALQNKDKALQDKDKEIEELKRLLMGKENS